MMKRLFSTKNSSSNSNTGAGRRARPSSPPPNIFPGYYDGNASAAGSNFFSGTAPLPQNGNVVMGNGINGVNGVNTGYAPSGYLNGNGVTAANGGGGGPGHHYSSSNSSVNGSFSHPGYLNRAPASSANGSDSGSVYGGSTLVQGNSNTTDAGYRNIPLPPAAPVTSPTGSANGQQYPPHGGQAMANYQSGYNGPSGSSPYPPRQPSVNYHQQQPHQYQALPVRGRRPMNPASEGLEAVPEQRAHNPSLHAPGRAVHVKVSAADVRDTTYMLRQLYKMELQIYSERYAVDRSGPEEVRREEMRRKVRLLREEIEDIVNTWSMTDQAGWTSEELQHVQYSLKVVSNLRTMGMQSGA